MKDIIQLLPDSVANQIAAGEVIQRPASVIKELVENAVDAGADRIDVWVVDAGRTVIRVVDNGKGMSETDARLSFERHATSKIKQADDLFNLHTMGFRGEALASIAAVAQVTLITKPENEELGTQIRIEGSKVVEQQPCASPKGSNFLVENLFYNIPARRKFLKSNATELNNIIAAFERIALVYPQIHFTLNSNGTDILVLRPGTSKQRIIDIFGKKLNQELLPVQVETSICSIKGFVGKPESARKRSFNQYFFVNGRYMKHPYFNKAIAQAYERIVPQGEQVSYFLYFEVKPQDIDVNIHPTKTEIKFENEQAVWQILYAAVKDAIGLFNDVPSIDFDTEGKPEIPVFNPQAIPQAPQINYNPHYNPFEKEMRRAGKDITDWDKLYEGLKSEQEQNNHYNLFATTDNSSSMLDDMDSTYYQYKAKYIIAAVKGGLLVVDQHRAHIRVCYEEFLNQMQSQSACSQRLMYPEMVDFSSSNRIILDTILPELQNIGFDLSPLDHNSYIINAIPDGLQGLDHVTLLQEMVAQAAENTTKVKEELLKYMATSLATAAAIPYGQILNDNEMRHLMERLFELKESKYSPQGQIIYTLITQNDIEQRFNN